MKMGWLLGRPKAACAPRTTARDYLDWYKPIIDEEIGAWVTQRKQHSITWYTQLTSFGDLEAIVEYDFGGTMKEVSVGIPFSWGGQIDRAELHRYLAYWILKEGRE